MDGSHVNIPVPSSSFGFGVLYATNVSDIAAGSSHNLAVDSQGRLISWGSNFHGETGANQFYSLGDRTQTNRDIPVFSWFSKLRRVISVAVGADHTLFLTESGEVWGVGGNILHQLEGDE
mmetsp:Transcript_2229/g.8220  ORF Transcript_2229/g.8220 Transcript_2229/m.8220 type:complete len:120 (+) Transcript_2229:3089-3448(+)